MFRRLAAGLTGLRPAVRRLAAAGAAAILAAGSLLTPQPAAAATAYPVNVTFLKAAFPQTNDGWDDDYLEVYGTVAAYTSAGAASAGGLPYRNFGTWGQNPSACPEIDDNAVPWSANGNFSLAPCPKTVVWPGPYAFNGVFLCKGATKSACATGWSTFNNTIPLQVHAGEQIILSVAMQDYDALSANDTVCVGNLKFGPYTDAELQAKKYVYDSQLKTVLMAYNGDASCSVSFALQ